MVALYKIGKASKRLNTIVTTAKTGDTIDLARRNIAETINEMKISMFDEIERLVSVKNTLERDLEKNPNNPMIIAKLEEIKRLIKVASVYYEVDVV
nr:MAG TPA: hypothetical protein [Caudoviricetes sp.]